MRTISEPASASSMHCCAVAAASAVSVMVIDCTTTGAPPPTWTWPTRTPTVRWRRAMAGTASIVRVRRRLSSRRAAGCRECARPAPGRVPACRSSRPGPSARRSTTSPCGGRRRGTRWRAPCSCRASCARGPSDRKTPRNKCNYSEVSSDVVVVGGGAAGLATAIFAARAAPALRVVVLDGARKIGAKILVSGGSRCNVTNRVVTERDFWGGPSRLVAHVLRAFPADRAARFFDELGVPLHDEEDGKLFPDSNSARTVLDALLSETDRRGVTIETESRVVAARHDGQQFLVECASGRTVGSRAVVLATGGRSLPKSGSDGFGYQLAAGFGHACVPTTPALAPLVLRGSTHAELAGVAHPVALTLRAAEKTLVRLEGPLLWTHFGASGPAVLNLSRHWHRARLEAPRPGDATTAIEVHVAVLPGETFESLERWLLDEAARRPRAQVVTVLAQRLP